MHHWHMNLYPLNGSVETRTLIYLCRCVSGTLRKKRYWHHVLELISTDKIVIVDSQAFLNEPWTGQSHLKKKRKKGKSHRLLVLSMKFNPEAPKEKTSISLLKWKILCNKQNQKKTKCEKYFYAHNWQISDCLNIQRACVTWYENGECTRSKMGKGCKRRVIEKN